MLHERGKPPGCGPDGFPMFLAGSAGIAEHPLHSASSAAEQDAGADARFRHLVRQLHAQGPRCVAELLAEIGERHMVRTSIDTALARYAAIDDAALYVAGGDRTPRVPLHEVRR